MLYDTPKQYWALFVLTVLSNRFLVVRSLQILLFYCKGEFRIFSGSFDHLMFVTGEYKKRARTSTYSAVQLPYQWSIRVRSLVSNLQLLFIILTSPLGWGKLYPSESLQWREQNTKQPPLLIFPTWEPPSNPHPLSLTHSQESHLSHAALEPQD